MAKIPSKRMYDVIAELQSPPSSVVSGTTCSRLAATLVDLPITKRIRSESDKHGKKDQVTHENKTETPLQDTQQTNKPAVSYERHLRHVQESISNLREVYFYGLQTVSELQDLQHAPDAILPGNFVLEDEYETGERITC